MEACKKEHEKSVKSAVEAGNYINGILNDTSLMELFIENGYPKGDTDVSIITGWFRGVFTLKSKNLKYELEGIRSKINKKSLEKQIRSKNVISKCDYVLLFVCFLRSIGRKCGLVINLAVPPIPHEVVPKPCNVG